MARASQGGRMAHDRSHAAGVPDETGRAAGSPWSWPQFLVAISLFPVSFLVWKVGPDSIFDPHPNPMLRFASDSLPRSCSGRESESRPHLPGFGRESMANNAPSPSLRSPRPDFSNGITTLQRRLRLVVSPCGDRSQNCPDDQADNRKKPAPITLPKFAKASESESVRCSIRWV